jgi:hypothetical protein
MPGLGLHVVVARELAAELASPRIDGERGSYYLGATTPDIRALTRWDRERTHFFSLDDFGQQSGVHRLFEEQPDLRDASSLDAATAAFMAGYISHLVLDEQYICQIYRPLFGERSTLGGDELADVMDKALQWDIERGEREGNPAMDEIRLALAETAVEINVDFVARETLAEWRDVSLDVLSAKPSVERLVRFLGRRLPQVRFDDESSAARFAEEVPGLLQRTWQHVGEERVREYLHGSRARAGAAMKEYLS